MNLDILRTLTHQLIGALGPTTRSLTLERDAAHKRLRDALAEAERLRVENASMRRHLDGTPPPDPRSWPRREGECLCLADSHFTDDCPVHKRKVGITLAQLFNLHRLVGTQRAEIRRLHEHARLNQAFWSGRFAAEKLTPPSPLV